MARRPSTHPTDPELEILRVLWDGGPMLLGEICSTVRQKRPVATTTIATTLGFMMKKGYVKRREGPRGYIWAAAIKQQATAKQVVNKIVDYVFGGSAGQLVAHLLDNKDLNDAEVEKIRKLLKDHQRRKGGDSHA